MPNLNELEKELSRMSSRQYSERIRKVEATRRCEVQQHNQEHPPEPGMSKQDFARWIAQQHFDIDKGIGRIVYLPTGAPENEIRLLEVNELASIPEKAPSKAVDFRPEIDGVDFAVFVADITPRQLDEILRKTIPLPNGWKLDDSIELDRVLTA